MSAAVLACAMALDGAFGEPRWLWSRLPHPAVLMGRAVAFLEDHLNRPPARPFGVLATTVLVIGSGCLGFLLSGLGPLIECLIAAILLAQRSLVQHVARVADGLRMSLPAGRHAVAMIVSRDTKDMGPSDVSRSALESLAENFSDGVIAPAFWYLVAGLPGILIYKTVNTADSMVGYLTPRYAAYGWSTARLDDVLNWFPARLTALLLSIVSGTTGRWRDIADDAQRHKSPNAGWPEAALAQSQNFALAGPRVYDGVLRDFAWVNPTGKRDLSPPDIDAGLNIVWKSWGLALALLFGTTFINWII